MTLNEWREALAKAEAASILLYETLMMMDHSEDAKNLCSTLRDIDNAAGDAVVCLQAALRRAETGALRLTCGGPA